MCKLCVFAGTSEGRQFIEGLQGRGARITACTATEYGGQLLEDMADVTPRMGRMDEGQMEAFFAEERFDCIVDATHPYADAASANIAAAAEASGIPILRISRGSARQARDGLFFACAEDCACYLQSTEGNILLTTGSKELAAFCLDEALTGRIYARVLPVESSVAACAACGIKPSRIIAMQGPFDTQMNIASLRFSNARYMVTKDTGGAGGYEAKIQAAEEVGAQALIIGRPREAEGLSVEEAIAEVARRFDLKDAQKRVILAGIGMGSAETRTLGLESALIKADLILGAKRMLESVDTRDRRVRAAIAPDEIVSAIREDPGHTALVLLSGDSGFFSGAKRLIERLDHADVTVLPGISSLQYMCARLQRAWEGVKAISLHGREGNLAAEVRGHGSVFALLGGANTARAALEDLQAAGFGDLMATVGENLGYPEERLTSDCVERLAQRDFAPLSVLLVDNPRPQSEDLRFGLPDEDFLRDETPMTKSEVRAVSLSKLCLRSDSVVYDVGSGSGSVTVEAARLASRGTVYAIEVKPAAAALTRANAQAFGLSNVKVIEGRAPEALETLPPPTHAFIGGSGGELKAVVDALRQKSPRVRIVANAVTLESVSALSEIANEFAHSDIACLSVTKPRKLGRYRLMTAQNPVYIFTFWDDEGE